jgi:hypothetical protein
VIGMSGGLLWTQYWTLGCIKEGKDFLFNWATVSFSRTAAWSCCVIYMLQVSQWLKRKQLFSYPSFISKSTCNSNWQTQCAVCTTACQSAWKLI